MRAEPVLRLPQRQTLHDPVETAAEEPAVVPERHVDRFDDREVQGRRLGGLPVAAPAQRQNQGATTGRDAGASGRNVRAPPGTAPYASPVRGEALLAASVR